MAGKLHCILRYMVRLPMSGASTGDAGCLQEVQKLQQCLTRTATLQVGLMQNRCAIYETELLIRIGSMERCKC